MTTQKRFALALPLFLAACGLEEAPSSSSSPSDVAETTADLTLGGDLTIRPPVFPTICGLHLRNYFPPAFEFDGGNGQSWQLDGVYHGNGTGQAAVVAVAAPWLDQTNYPNANNNDPVDARGSIFFIGHPTFGQAESSGFWFIDFVSPPLTEAWQTYSAFRYSVLDEISFANPPLFAQLVLKVRKCDGSIAFFSEVNAAGNRVFCQLRQDHAWTDCQTRITLPANTDRILNMMVRVFVPAGGAYEGPVFLDRVRPL